MGFVVWDGPTASWKHLGSLTVDEPVDPPVDPPEDPGPGTGLAGWLKTPSNTGLASKGVTTSMLTGMTVPQYTGNLEQAGVNIASGIHSRRRFNLGWNTLAPGDNTIFNECLIEGTGDMVQIHGTNVQFNDCDFVLTGGPDENVHVNANWHYVRKTARITMNNCRMTGGTIFINLTGVGGDINDVYGYAQQPETGLLQHRDGFTSREASAANPVTLRRCRFDTDQNSTTGAFFLQNTYGNGVVGVSVYDSMFEGAGNCLTLENSQQLRFVNNRMRPHGSYSYGPVVSTGCTFAQWTDNFVYSPTNPDYRGAALNQP